MIEDGSEIAAELWDSDHTAASSILSYSEGRAALAAAHRAGRLTAEQHTEAIADFEEVQRELVVLGVDQALAHDAGQLADDLGLRGYDAVHLALALALVGDDAALVTWDRDLSHAAMQVGLAVAP